MWGSKSQSINICFSNPFVVGDTVRNHPTAQYSGSYGMEAGLNVGRQQISLPVRISTPSRTHTTPVQ